MNASTSGSASVQEGIIASGSQTEGGGGFGTYYIEVVRNGEVIDSFESPNTIVNQGLTYKTAVALLNGTQIAAWNMGLLPATPSTAAGNTYAVPNNTEITAYDETVREVWTGVAGAAGVSTNAASRAEFTISSSVTVGGVFLAGGTGSTTKGDTAGAGAVLFSQSAFTGGNRALVDNDVLRVTYEHTDANL